MTITNDYAIVVENLTKRYGNVCAVDGISFTVKQGEVFAFLGPNGAGKTTTVEIIETIRAPTSGNVRVLGMDVTSQKRDIVQRIGVLPQGFSSFDRLTVAETIRFFARLFGRSNVDVEGLMARANLQDKRDAQFKTLSGGMRQSLGLVIAMVNEPEVLMLDEPTTGLDPHARHAVWNVLVGLKSRGAAIFLTTHYIEEAELLADTVAIIAKGKIVAIGSPSELIERHAPCICVTLRTEGNGALEAICRIDLQPVQDTPDTIKVTLERADDVRRILGALTVAGVPLLGLDVRKPSLEDAYLNLTHGSLSDTVSMAADGVP